MKTDLEVNNTENPEYAQKGHTKGTVSDVDMTVPVSSNGNSNDKDDKDSEQEQTSSNGRDAVCMEDDVKSKLQVLLADNDNSWGKIHSEIKKWLEVGSEASDLKSKAGKSINEERRFKVFTSFIGDYLDKNVLASSRKMMQLLCASSGILIVVKGKYKNNTVRLTMQP